MLTKANFDYEAIAALAKRLRLTWPITIKLKRGPLLLNGRACKTTRGVRRYREGEHVIELVATRTADEVNQTLAHELFHCSQAERHGEEWAGPLQGG